MSWIFFLLVVILIVSVSIYYYFYRKSSEIVPPTIPRFKENDNFYDEIWKNKFLNTSIRPQCIIQPRTTKDLNHLINIEKIRDFSIRGCGYCTQKWSSSENFIFDMSMFNSVKIIDHGIDKIAMLEAGVDLHRAYKTIYELGYMFPAGSFLGNGVVAQSLSGGIGYLTRKFGLLSENIVAYKIFIASGDSIMVDENENSDLFYALKGCGASNFGIVTQIFVKLYKLPEKMICFKLTYDLKHLYDVLHWFTNDRRKKMSINLTCKLTIKDSIIVLSGQILGNVKLLRKQLEDLINPAESEVEYMNFSDAVDYFSYTIVQDNIKYKSSFGNTELDDKSITMLKNSIKDIGNDFTIELYMLKSKSVKETSIVNPNATYLITYSIYWNEDEEVKWGLVQLDALYEKMRLVLSSYSYMGFMDSEITNYKKAYYGKTRRYQKLLEIKEKYDPENIFNFPQGLWGV